MAAAAAAAGTFEAETRIDGGSAWSLRPLRCEGDDAPPRRPPPAVPADDDGGGGYGGYGGGCGGCGCENPCRSCGPRVEVLVRLDVSEREETSLGWRR